MKKDKNNLSIIGVITVILGGGGTIFHFKQNTDSLSHDLHYRIEYIREDLKRVKTLCEGLQKTFYERIIEEKQCVKKH